MGTMDKILIILAVFLLTFTVAMTICILATGGTFDTLIHEVFAGCLGEGGIMGVIKVTKLIKEGKNDDE